MAPVIVGGSDELLKEYLGRLVQEPVMAVGRPEFVLFWRTYYNILIGLWCD